MTQVTSAQANKILQAALFTAANRSHSLVNMLTEEAPKAPRSMAASRPALALLGGPGITDLGKGAGDAVDTQLFHQPSGRPTMGDQKLAGRLESMSSRTSLKINQTRHGVDAGGKMSQKRTKHDP